MRKGDFAGLLPGGRIEKSNQKEVRPVSLYEAINIAIRLVSILLAYLAYRNAKKKD